MSRARSRGMSGHQSAKPKTRNWLTPPEILAPLGPFDLDPCAPLRQPYPTAQHTFTRRDNGLKQDWRPFGRVWLNPPYGTGVIERWLAKLVEHGCGTALIFARTETECFFDYVWNRATGVLFIEGRLHFHRISGRRAPFNAGAPSVLCAYGDDDRDILASCGIAGQFIPLIFPRSVIALFAGTWRDLIETHFPDGPFTLDDLYRACASHPKAKTNAHAKEKLRQTLSRGGFKRVARGTYQRAA